MIDVGIKQLERISLPEQIVGEKIVIKKRTHEFDEQLWNLIDNSRDFLRPYLYWVDDTKSVEDVRQVTDIFMKNFDENKSFEYVILDKNTGKLVGAGGAHTVCCMHNYAEFGYYIDKNAAKCGYVTEFVKLLSSQLFSKGIHRLIITCDVDNQPSANIAIRCGFEFEGVMRGARLGYGEYRDQMLYAKINPL